MPNPTTPQVIQLHNVNSLHNSNFDSSKPIKVIVHGWNGDGSNSMNRQLTEAFLQDGDYNVFVLDWSQLANRNYLTAKNGVPAVGRRLGQFLNWLVSLGASFDTMHLVGFSLGGHLVGNAGRETGAQVRRITALDPAGPLWGGDRERLVETDARYVEVMHTNTLFLGFTDPCGHADFYPNGGRSMPGCWTNSCSHGRAVDYMVASIRYNHFLANECGSRSNATSNRCTGAVYHMGNSDLNKSGSGIYRVNTA
ncbi:lipase member H-like [Ostrinia nubilalis]|uniref:lipase member H-like n=1 Tax=Ostrinia nubilalis TaxID=29057 RepID=UPI0030823A6A